MAICGLAHTKTEHINSTDRHLKDLTHDKEEQPLTAPLRYGGGSGKIDSCAINKQFAFRQDSAPNPPQRKPETVISHQC